MDEQSGETEEEEVMGEGIGETESRRAPRWRLLPFSSLVPDLLSVAGAYVLNSNAHPRIDGGVQ